MVKSFTHDDHFIILIEFYREIKRPTTGWNRWGPVGRVGAQESIKNAIELFTIEQKRKNFRKKN